jgi:hypothetical protein
MEELLIINRINHFMESTNIENKNMRFALLTEEVQV